MTRTLLLEPLDEAESDLVLDSAVGRDAIPVTFDHLGELHVGLEALPLERVGPVLEEAPGPALAGVVPELAEGLDSIQGTHRYALTPLGLRLCTFMSRVYARVLRPGLSQVAPLAPPATSGRSSLQRAFDSCQRQVDRLIEEQRLAS
jgi:hypothetical protein